MICPGGQGFNSQRGQRFFAFFVLANFLARVIVQCHVVQQWVSSKPGLASSAGNSIGAFPGQNKRADMLSDGK